MIDRSLNYGRHLVRRFLRDAGEYRTVLDIGAGLGADLLAAAEVRPGARLHAVEVYPEYARRLESHGIEVHRTNLEREPIPLPDGSVDVVIANQVLEHTKEIFWIFHEISRILPVGGRAILGVPNLASLHNRLLLLLGRQPTAIQNATAHVRGYTRRDLLQVLERAFPGGYREAGFGGSNFYPFPPAVARPLAAAFPGMAWGIFLHLRKEREYGGEFLRFPVAEQLETNFFLG
jgi:SAM-dependent methyltransferase